MSAVGWPTASRIDSGLRGLAPAEGPNRPPGRRRKGLLGGFLAVLPAYIFGRNTYRWRVAMGPNYRADMWAVMEAEPGLTPSELARRTYGSFAAAWQVKKDWKLLVA